eukprot:scaffold13042_cov17-Tisochrysis_lutea.AAC.1
MPFPWTVPLVTACLLRQVGGVPEFLDPESTRPLAVSLTHGRDTSVTQAGSSRGGGGSAQSVVGKGSKGQVPGADFDVARLAPLLKGQKRWVDAVVDADICKCTFLAQQQRQDYLMQQACCTKVAYPISGMRMKCTCEYMQTYA